MNRQTLKLNYEQACNDYLKAFCKQYDYEYNCLEAWTRNDVGGMACVSDLFFNFADIKTAVDEDVPKPELYAWLDYQERVMALEMDFPIPNLHSWAHGCPRMGNDEIAKFENMKRELQDLADKTKNNLKNT